MPSGSYVIVFDFMEEAPPSILPFLGMLLVAAVASALAIWGTNIASRVIGAIMAIAVVWMATADLLNARADYSRTISDIREERVRIADGILHVTERGRFSINGESFALPRRPGARNVYAFNPDEIARFEGRCVRGRFTGDGKLAQLRVREAGADCNSGDASVL